jgi:hypothetical protein
VGQAESAKTQRTSRLVAKGIVNKVLPKAMSKSAGKVSCVIMALSSKILADTIMMSALASISEPMIVASLERHFDKVL